MISERTCPTCGGSIQWTRPKFKDEIRISCRSCGDYDIGGLTEQTLPDAIHLDPRLRDALPAWIKERNAQGEVPLVDEFTIDEALNP